MKYNICSSCVFFHPEVKDEERIVKRHCTCSDLANTFGPSCGFPSGVDVCHCDFFRQPSFFVCDVVFSYKGRYVGYVIPSVRPKSRMGVSALPDNSKNQKIISYG